MTNRAIKSRKNSWSGVILDVINRFSNAIKSIRFIFAFCAGLLVFGGAGIWLPYFISEDPNKVFLESQNLFTYSFAILGALFIETFFSKNNFDDLTFLGLSVGLISTLLCFFGYVMVPSGYELLTTCGAVLAVILYLLVNVNDEKYDSLYDDNSPSPIGYNSAELSSIKNKE